jgi:hypothetical protein
VALNAIDPANLRRKLPGGGTMVEAVMNGERWESAVGKLISLLASEQQERAAFIARSPDSRVDLSDAGLSHFQERV